MVIETASNSKENIVKLLHSIHIIRSRTNGHIKDVYKYINCKYIQQIGEIMFF